MLMKFQAFNKELQRRIESASRKEAHGGDGATDAGDPTPAKEPPATSSASQGADEATSTSESTETGAGAGAGAGSTTSGRGGVKLGGGDALSELVRIGATLHSCEKDLRGLSKEVCACVRAWWAQLIHSHGGGARAAARKPVPHKQGRHESRHATARSCPHRFVCDLEENQAKEKEGREETRRLQPQHSRAE